MPRSERRRVFLGVWPPEAVLQAMGDAVEQAKAVASAEAGLASAIRWMEREVWHLTVVFVGSVDAGGLGDLEAKARRFAACHSRFDITFEGAGAFPGIRRPRVLWFGVDSGVESWNAFAGALREVVATKLPLKREKGHVPHVTVARVKRPVDVGAVVDALCTLRPVSMTVSRLALVESRLKPSGAEYTTLDEFDLTG